MKFLGTPIAAEGSRGSLARVTSEWVWVSLKKWDSKPLRFFAEWIVYIVQQTVQKLRWRYNCSITVHYELMNRR